jgi:hypothetical protein
MAVFIHGVCAFVPAADFRETVLLAFTVIVTLLLEVTVEAVRQVVAAVVMDTVTT